MRARALLIVLAAAGCADPVTVTVVTVHARPAVHAVESLDVTFGNDNATLAQTFNVHGKDFPLTFSVETPGRTGALTIDVQALDADGDVAGLGSATATIVTDDVTDADLLLDPADFVVNTSVSGAQKLAWDASAGGFQVAAAPDGTFTIGFTDDCGALGRCDVWGRRFDASAVALTSDIQSSDQQFNINRTNVFGNDPSLAMNADGTMLAAWTTFDQILAVAISPTGGATAASETLLSDGTTPGQPAVAALPDGRFVVVWAESDLNTGARKLRGRLVDATGATSANPETGDDTAFTIDTANDFPELPAVTAGGDGLAMGFAWRDGTTVRTRFTTSGGLLEPQQQIDVLAYDPADFVWSPKIAPAASDRYLVAWGHEGGDGDATIVARTVAPPTGTAIGADLLVAHGLADTFTSFGLAAEGDDYVAVWQACGTTGDGGGCGIRMQPFSSTALLGDAVVADTTTAGDQTTPSIAALGDGAFLTTWTDDSLAAPDTSDTSIRARVVYPSF